MRAGGTTQRIDGGLDGVLATVPGDLAAAADAVVARASLLLGSPVTVASWSDGGWRLLGGAGTGIAGLPLAGPAAAGVTGRGFVTSTGGVALCWDPGLPVDASTLGLLRRAGVWLSLAAAADSAGREVAAAGAETEAVREVARQLLSVRDLDRLLHSIAERTLRLLDADICGVLLREGEVVRMRACVGNRAAETARLAMRRGQGVAGMVFLTGEPAKTDSYVDDTRISQDFMSLAVEEQTRSALAVPLRLHGELIGVLEVWRRRTSVFRDADVRRIVTLADFATIAIDNARLYDEQVAAAAETEHARDRLARQVALLNRASRLQQELLTTVVEGGGLAAVLRTVAVRLGCQVGVYGADGALQAAHSGRRLVSALPAAMADLDGGTGGRGRWVRPVYADGDQVGQVVLLRGDEPAEAMEMAAGNVAMACSLALLRERAASRARAEATEQVLWDLLQGPIEHRLAARTRAQQIGVVLGGRLRVVAGRLENLATLAAERGWDTSQTERARRQLLRTVRALEDGRGLALASLRGNELVAVAVDLERSAARDLVGALADAVRRVWPDLALTWGISREHPEAVELPSALNEARTALSAARRLGGRSIFLYEELGIVRLLLGSGDDPDLQTFVDEVTGPLVAYDRDNDGALVRTLRAFFDADCSQRAAAERLFVHHKTLRYRLERIRQLTGLDLARHEDRMRADFALRLLQVNQPAREDDEEP